ncbi:MAG: BtpA/SgcQ family protein [Phycisphaerales bacterium]|nr:BtpA/SgcQ family protein [Phycisphaerales bacterium]
MNADLTNHDDAAAIFGRTKAMVGMVHVAALPGTPRCDRPVSAIAEQAQAEAVLLHEAGFDAIILENMHDVPYLRREVGPEIVAGMTAVARAVRQAVPVPIGIQILAGANAAALAVAQAADCRFIRAEGFVFASIADEGILGDADAGPLLRYRKQIGAEHIAVLTDIKKKHSSHAITADIDLAETARAAEFFGAAGLIVTGTATGEPTDPDDLRVVREASPLPLAVGSGVTPETIPTLFEYADALIVGSWYKVDGRWDNPPDPNRAAEIIRAADLARETAKQK